MIYKNANRPFGLKSTSQVNARVFFSMDLVVNYSKCKVTNYNPLSQNLADKPPLKSAEPLKL
jgi:hypothetical protein